MRVKPIDLFRSGRAGLTFGVCLIVTLIAFELMGATTAMPAALDDLGGLGMYGWAISAPLLGGAIAVPLGGRLADERGPALPCALALGCFAVGLVGAGFAPTMGVVALFRFVQGIGAGILFTLQLAIVSRAYVGELRGPMLAVISTTWILPSLVGPALAGIVAQHVGWRWVFFGVLPLVGLVAVLVLPRLRAFGAPEPGATRGTAPWWRQPGPRAAASTALLVCFGFFTAEAFLPLVLTKVEGFSFAAAGLPLSFSGIGWTTGAWIQARTPPSAWARTASTGAVLIAVGVLATATMLLDAVPPWVCYVSWCVAAFGMGLTYTILQHVAIDTATRGREASAGAAIELANLVGVAAGTGLAGVVVAHTTANVQAGFASVFGVCAAVALGGAVLARRLPVPMRKARETEPQHASATL